MFKASHMVYTDKDLVGRYAKFRPSPPPNLVETVVRRVMGEGGKGGLAVDMGCGSGQNTSFLAPYFTKVVGVDVSEQQLGVARQTYGELGNVSFRVGSAEVMSFEAGTVDLVTCCAAIHWFDFDPFYKEVDRVLRPGGVVACYSYFGCSPIYKGRNLRETFIELWRELAGFWTAGHDHLWDEYSNLPQLYPNDTHIGSVEGGYSVECPGSLEHILGYMNSVSAVNKMRAQRGEEAAQHFLAEAKRRLLKAAGADDDDIEITRQYNYFVRMWQKPPL